MEAVSFVTVYCEIPAPRDTASFQAYTSVGSRIALFITHAYLEIVGGNSDPENNGPMASNVWQVDFAARADK